VQRQIQDLFETLWDLILKFLLNNFTRLKFSLIVILLKHMQ